MNKKFLIPAFAMVILLSVNSTSYANESEQIKEEQSMKIERSMKNFNAPRHHKFHGQRPSKAQMEAKKAEFEKRLNLTEEQKQQIDKNKQKDREKMKPIFEKMAENKAKIREIHQDKTLSPEDKVKKSAQYEKNLIDLKVKANELRKENMKSFENILTSEQKEEFSKIREEQKQEMEKRRKEHYKSKRWEHPQIGLPVQPRPLPIEK